MILCVYKRCIVVLSVQSLNIGLLRGPRLELFKSIGEKQLQKITRIVTSRLPWTDRSMRFHRTGRAVYC